MSQVETDSGTTAFVFTVTLDSNVDTPLTVDYATADGTAENELGDGDYLSTTGNLGFVGLAGETLQVTVLAQGDTKVEIDETFDLLLSALNANGRDVSIADSTGVATLTNDDSATLSIDDVTQVETDSGTTIFRFDVTLDNDVQDGLTVAIDTQDGTAVEGGAGVGDDDYETNTGSTIDFVGTLGETHQFDVKVNGDEVVELDEIFDVLLGALTNIGPTAADDITTVDGQGTIVNDDQALISIDDVSQSETDGVTTFTFTVSSTNQVDTTVTMTADTSDGSAVEGAAGAGDDDYLPISGATVTFLAGSTSETIDVTINGDDVVELDENFFVNLTNLLAGGRDVALADDQGEGTIENDDSATLSIGDVSQSETDAVTTFSFPVTLSGQVDTTVSTAVNAADDSAVEGGGSVGDDDYEAISGGTVSFIAGGTAENDQVE